MKYQKTIQLKDGRCCCLRNASAADASAVLANFILTHGQTDFLTTYPEECTRTGEEESRILQAKAESEREIEIMAEVDGVIAGTAGIDALGRREKLLHRANFGISIDRCFWGLGIGRALLEACIECARKAGYEQLELEVVTENERAVELYKRAGFTEYGRNPKGFRSRSSGYQELVYMRLELQAEGGTG